MIEGFERLMDGLSLSGERDEGRERWLDSRVFHSFYLCMDVSVDSCCLSSTGDDTLL